MNHIVLRGYKELLKIGKINNNTVYNHVVEGRITTEDYKLITEMDCPELPIENIRKKVIKEMSEMCEYKIINEFYSDCLGEMLHFGCKKDEDQQWIMGKFFKAQLIKQSNPELADVQLETLAWKNQDALACFPFSPNQMITLGSDMETHLTEKKNKFYDLRMWALDEARTVEELQTWTWDMVI